MADDKKPFVVWDLATGKAIHFRCGIDATEAVANGSCTDEPPDADAAGEARVARSLEAMPMTELAALGRSHNLVGMETMTRQILIQALRDRGVNVGPSASPGKPAPRKQGHRGRAGRRRRK